LSASNVKNFHHCPDELVSILALTCTHRNEWDSMRQVKEVREFSMCTSRNRDARHRSHMLEKKKLRNAGKRNTMEHPHMGKKKVAKHSSWMLETDFAV
jgi:hypothetical protein